MYRVKKSEIGDFFVCDCAKGIKKHVCKHAVIAMVKVGIFSFPAGVKDLAAFEELLKGIRKRGRPRSDVGRPPKIPKQSRFASVLQRDESLQALIEKNF